MKDFFLNNKFKLLIAVVFIMFGLMLYTASTPGSALASLFSFISTPMQQLSAGVTGDAAAAAEPVLRSKEDLLAENNALRRKVSDLETQLQEYNKYKLENAQLRQFLELKDSNPDFQLLPAAVVGRDPAELFGGFSVDKGSLDGVVVGDPVFVREGVVGKVSQVFTTSSRVTTLLSPDNNDLAAIDSVNRDSGIVQCDLKLADQGLVRLSYLTTDTKVKAGDTIITSGAGGVYPSGLKIGVVQAVEHSATDVSLFATVKPFADVKTLRDVMIIVSFKGQGQVLADPPEPAAPEAD